MFFPKSEKKSKEIRLMIPSKEEINDYFSKNLNKSKRNSNKTRTFMQKPLEILSLKNNPKKFKRKTSQILISNSNSFIDNNNSNLKTQGNTFISNNANINLLSENTSSDNIIDKTRSKNLINYKDRKKLKAIKLLGLKLYEQFEVEKRKMSESNLSKFNFISNNDNVNTDLIRINNVTENNQFDFDNNSFMGSFYNIEKNKKKKNKRKLQYSLNQLMKLNPYHYVSTRVRYNNAIQMEKISEKLSNVNSFKPHQSSKSNNHFFTNSNKKINTKIIKSVRVRFNDNLAYKGGLVWRILSKLQKNNVPSEFRQTCKFQGYKELWKYYGMLIEKLILNYPTFKWFLEKEKTMEEEVFNEYLQCLKIDLNIDSSFPSKVYLLFDDSGEGKINIKNFFFVMKLTSSSNSDIDKYNFYMKLFEDVHRKNMELCINVLEIYDIFKNLIDYKEWSKIKNNLIKNLRSEFNDNKIIGKDFYISKNQMINFLINNKLIKKLMDNFIREYNYAYINYNEKINNIFFNTVKNVRKFVNEQKDINCVCKTRVNNYEKILESVDDKMNNLEKLNELKKDFENDE
jgi:hypothetical protein